MTTTTAHADLVLVERDVPATDRRARTVALTDAGHAPAVRSAAAAVDLAASVLADWDESDLATATRQLRRVADAVVRHHVALASRAGIPAATHQPLEREIA